MALYRKYRPATFAEVVGQEHVTDPLSIALDTGRISHAYLFSGPRGCGKTSSARILARSLNCVSGPTSTPCGTCPSCVALGPGGTGNLDVIELDAASHGGVDDTRELRDRAFYAPAESRYRVFIVDEAHMVTTAGFNALLKIVEEPPAHLIFIFATTEPDKVLPTIRSRTHHYPFRLLPPATMRGLLGRICEQEHVPVEEAVYPLVIRAGGGSPRDSLSVLDQLLAGAGPEGVTYARAVSLLGVTDVALIDDAVEALAADDGAALFGTVDRVMEAGHDPRRFAADLLDRFRDLILMRAVPDATERGLVAGPGDVLDRMRGQAERLGSATLTRYAQLLHEGLGEMRGATAPRLLLEVVCARMLLPSASDAESATLQRLERLERGMAGGPFAAAPAASSAPAPAQPTHGAGSPSESPRRRGAEALAAIRRENRGGGRSEDAAEAGGATPVGGSAQTEGSGAGTADRPVSIGGAGSPSSGAAGSTVAAPGGGHRPMPAGGESSTNASAPGTEGGADPVAPVAEPAAAVVPDSGSAGTMPAGGPSATAAPSASKAGTAGGSGPNPEASGAVGSAAAAGAGRAPSGPAAVQRVSEAVAQSGLSPSPQQAGSPASGGQAASPTVDPAVGNAPGADPTAARDYVRGAADSTAAPDSAVGPDRGAADSTTPRNSAGGSDQGAAESTTARDSAVGPDRGAADSTAGLRSGREHGSTGRDTARSSVVGPGRGAAESSAGSSSGREDGSAGLDAVRSSAVRSGRGAVESSSGREDGSAGPDAARSSAVGRDPEAGDPSTARRTAAGPERGAADSPAVRDSAAGQGDSGRSEAGPPHASAQEPTGPSSAPSGDLLREVEAAWADIRAKVREFGAAVQAMLAGASVARVEGEVIVFAHQHAPLAQRLSDPRNLEAVRSAVRAVLGRDHEVRWEAGGASPRPAPAPRAGGSGNRARGQAAGQPGRESGNATGRAPDAAAPPRFSRPSQARNAGAEKPGNAGRARAGGASPRPFPAEDDIPPPDYPDLPDDPGPADYPPPYDAEPSESDAASSRGWSGDGAVPASTPEEEREMMAAAADPVAPGDRRDPDEVALELLKSELGATRLDG
ncbi:DNA polymerase III subunit gamma/tau [Nocardia gamkensis]|nr:DNA polymerase III subunit gamma/tau [Nocardia gamkensis]